jgi:natural product biosynthesis luciferase-like monooxygenase protein
VFPNPSVLCAALAVATDRIALRAGSVVLPLHQLLRIVEEWAVVDNLCGGRTGISLATGWHTTDFVLAPGQYPERREYTMRCIPLLRRLWAGEGVLLPDGNGQPITVHPGPRPVSRSLPLWLTASGRPQTWDTAGQLRMNVLSATAGQTRTELADKIASYRQSYQSSSAVPGTAARGTVTLMAHTYVGADDDDAIRRVTRPLRAYLKSYVTQTAGSRDAQGRLASTLGAAEQDKLAEFALRRYLAWGSLLGSAQSCAKSLADLRDLGCDEVACFVDFGLGRDEVLSSLHRLAELRTDLAA